MSNLFCVDNLTVKTKDIILLDSISFKVDSGSVISILSPNNCGKTTLIKSICGILPSKDVIKLDDISLNKKTARKYLREIGIVFTEIDKQFLFEDVIDELSFSLENLDLSKKDIKERINNLLKEFKLESLTDKKTKELSSLQKVQTLLLISIIHSPKIIFLDDILLSLDIQNRLRIIKMLKKIAMKSISVIYTTSSLLDAYYSDRIIVINDKKIMMSGTPKEITNMDNELVKIGIEIPTMMDISLKLKFYEILDEVILDVDGMVNKLWL